MLADKKIFPDRYLNKDGIGVHPIDADGKIDIIFLRNDGWSVGCSKNNWQQTYLLWPKSWKYVAHGKIIMTHEEFNRAMITSGLLL